MLKNKKNVNFRFLLVVLVLIIASQIILTVYSNNAFHSFLVNTQDWYQNFSVKRIANLTSTSLELLVETQMNQKEVTSGQKSKVINSLDIIFSQHIMEKSADEICLFIYNDGKFIPINDGEELYSLLYENAEIKVETNRFEYADSLFQKIKMDLIETERIKIITEDEKIFHVFVPFVPDGEFIGALYMKVKPNFSILSKEFVSTYNDFSKAYIIVIFAGLVLIYIVFSYTLNQRDKAQKLAYLEHEKFLKEKIEREKENTFTRRIYHAYHKAEKIIGFINNDLEVLGEKNLEEIRSRVGKYTNFIGRVIYDMKYYDPPIHSIINPIFQTDLNEVCRFIVENMFMRIYKKSSMFTIREVYDNKLPIININEFVIWEIIEPLIQNSISHNANKHVNVVITTKYDAEANKIYLTIQDDGIGIKPELLKQNEDGIKKIFLENVSTKNMLDQKYGLGCYIAYILSTKYLGWTLDAENTTGVGCVFTLNIPV